MEKDLYKKYPFTAFAFVLIGALFLQSMLVGNDSVMTNAIIQAGWCKAGNYICLVWRYASISLLIIFLGLLIDGLVKWLSNKRNFKKGKTEIEISSKSLPEEKVRRPKVVDRFSFHLDAGIKELNKHPLFKLSSNGRNFLQRIKNSPPFLGLDFGQPVIRPLLERKLTEHFQANDFLDKYAESIRGNERYTITNEDTTWEDVSKKYYGSEKYANQLRHYSMPEPRTGAVIILPLIDTSGKLGVVSSEYIESKQAMASNGWISSDIQDFRNEYSLTWDEVSPLLAAIYEAAQKTLEERENV